uniref:Uncharacterized protein n=1 Tax=Lepeophtheirus salmonis TaxID=72036 RepID=A0A0K2UBA6_LEPSM
MISKLVPEDVIALFLRIRRLSSPFAFCLKIFLFEMNL